jgi:hypothetical protein
MGSLTGIEEKLRVPKGHAHQREEVASTRKERKKRVIKWAV